MPLNDRQQKQIRVDEAGQSPAFGKTVYRTVLISLCQSMWSLPAPGYGRRHINRECQAAMPLQLSSFIGNVGGVRAPPDATRIGLAPLGSRSRLFF